MSSHKHKKQFGQNFLNNPNVITNIVSAIGPQPDQHLVEIGPGEAALTEPLLDRVAKLDIIEIDRDLIAPLTQRFQQHPAFHLHNADALKYDYRQLTRPGEKLRMVGNLPYNISSPLIFHLLDQAEIIQDMHFMLQKEVVERLTATPGNKAFGRLSVMVQYACQTEYLFTVGPENFTPAPKVDSAIVRLTPHPTPLYQADNVKDFAAVVKQAFSQKRKTLRNTLKNWLNTEQIELCQIDPGLRAEALEVADFVKLANLYSQVKPDQ